MIPESVVAFWLRIKALFRRRQLDRDLDDELQYHLAMREQRLADQGVPAEEAHYAARRAFGNAMQTKELNREIWSFVFIESLWQDVRFGLRQLGRSPGFTVVAVLTLALGIGANTAIFSVVNAVLLHPLAYPDASRLIWLTNYDKYFKQDDWGARADYVIWKREAHSFESMTAYGNEDLSLMTDHGAAQERIASITGDFWNITGARPALGRLFGPGEAHTLVLSYGLFERAFASDPHIIGKTLTPNGYPFTVMGVLAKRFRFLFPQQTSWAGVPPEIDAYIPIPNAAEVPGEIITRKLGPAPPWVCVVGRLRDC